MSKKKKYFLINELSSIIESSSSEKSVRISTSTLTDSPTIKPRRMPKPATPGTSLKRISNKPFVMPSSNVCCIQELDDRCLIKIPKKKISFSDDSTGSVSLSSKEKTPIESILKKKSSIQIPKCKVITVFGKKCPPPPGLKTFKTDEKKTKSNKVDFSDQINTEIEKLASLLKESATNLKKFKKDATSTTSNKSTTSMSSRDEKALVLRPHLTVSKYQPFSIKKLDTVKPKSLLVKKQPLKIKSSDLVETNKSIDSFSSNSSKNSLQTAIDIEIEKLVALLNETKEILGNKLAKKNNLLTRKPKNSEFKKSKSSHKLNKDENKEKSEPCFQNKINREIEKIAILLKDPPSSIVRSAEKKPSKKSESIKLNENISKSQLNESISSKRKKDIILLKIDLADEKTTIQKLKKSSTNNKSLEPSNLKKEIKLFKQEKEKEKEKESFMSKMKLHLKEKLDIEKLLATRKQIKASKLSLTPKKSELTPVSLPALPIPSLQTTTTTITNKKLKEDKPTLVVSLKECFKPKCIEPVIKIPAGPPPPPQQQPIVTLVNLPIPKLETRTLKIKTEPKVKEKEKTKEKLDCKIESSIRDEKENFENFKSVKSKRNPKLIEKEKVSILIDTSNTVVNNTSTSGVKPNETSKIIISKEPKKINDSFKKVSSSTRRKILSILNKKIPIISSNEPSKDDLPLLKIESKVIVVKSPEIKKSKPTTPPTATCESPEVIIKQKIKHLGIVETNPDDYMKQYGPCLIQPKDLPKFVLDICPPEGIKLAANTLPKPIELEGDVHALKLVDHEVLARAGLSQYKNI